MAEFWVRVPGRVLDVRHEVRDGVEFVVKVLDDDTHRPGTKDEHQAWWQKTWSASINPGSPGSEAAAAKAEAKRKRDAEYAASRSFVCENCGTTTQRPKGEKAAAPKVCMPCRAIYAAEGRKDKHPASQWAVCAVCGRTHVCRKIRSLPIGWICTGCVAKHNRGKLVLPPHVQQPPRPSGE